MSPAGMDTFPAGDSSQGVTIRIISAAPSNTEIIAGLGLGDRLVAVDKYSRDVAGINKDLPEIDFFYPNFEVIAGLEPDIILTNEINTNGDDGTPFKFLDRLGIRVVQIPTSNSIEGIYRDIALIAETLGVSDRGETMIREMREAIESLTAQGRTIAEADKKRVYFEITPAPNMVSFGRGTYLNEMIEIIGARNIFANVSGWFTPGAEEIIRANPDVIFTMTNSGGSLRDREDTTAELKRRPGFQTINAVQQNRIYTVNSNWASRPSQFIVLALSQMRAAVYEEE
ncbi:ABC transporter substrate-binding protein [Spirochaetia bacterium]|nr:ABC transporter substrate-binding protein [Spirochaetia bacterium]